MIDDFENDTSDQEQMYKTNNNYGEFIVSLSKINGSLGFSLRSDPEDTTALRLVIEFLYISTRGKSLLESWVTHFSSRLTDTP